MRLSQYAETLVLFVFFHRIEPCFFEFVVRNGIFHSLHNKFDPPLDFLYLVGNRGSLPQLYQRPGCVQQLQRLRWKRRLRRYFPEECAANSSA